MREGVQSENRLPEHTLGVSNERPAFIGRYRVLNVLGKGTFGKVFLGKHPDLDKRVAIESTAQPIGHRALLLEEGRRMATLEPSLGRQRPRRGTRPNGRLPARHGIRRREDP